MIVQLTGKVRFPITLDPTVWIFDDRKIPFDQAFSNPDDQKTKEADPAVSTSERWSREVYQQRIKPPVNKSISKFEREQILEGTFVMPIRDFLTTAEVETDASKARIITTGREEEITLKQLTACYLLFAEKGKPVKEDGPVHLYFHDQSNFHVPIKGIKKIILE